MSHRFVALIPGKPYGSAANPPRTRVGTVRVLTTHRPDWAAEPYEHLRAERRRDQVALVTLDLPERRNMMSAAMTGSWGRLMSALRLDRELRCVVVTGAGSAFCSAGDTEWIASRPDAGVAEQRARMLPFYRGLARRPRPRGAHHRRGERAGDRRRAGAGARVRPALRRPRGG